MRRTAFIVTLAIGLSLVASGASAERSGQRLSGDSRIQTATEIADTLTPNKYRVYLARADKSADALAAGALFDGPVILVPPCGPVPDDVSGFLDRSAGPNAEIIALGGQSAICDDLLVAAADGRPSSRIDGANRFATAANIALRAFPDGAREVYLGNGFESPDPVAGGTLVDGPLLLVPPSGPLPPEVSAAIEALDPARVVALGGTVAIGEDILTSAAAGRATRRLAGESRFDTAVAISRYLFGDVDEPQTSEPMPARTVYIARGDVFADALAAGVVTDGPILLVPSCGVIPPAVAAEIARLHVEQVVILGGFSAVCSQMQGQAQNAPGEAGASFSFHRRVAFAGLHAHGQTVVPLVGATMTYNGMTKVTDDAGQVTFPLPSDPDGTPWRAFTVTDTPEPFRDLDVPEDSYASACSFTDFESMVCNVDLQSFTISTGITYPDNDGRNPPIVPAQSVRLEGPITATASSEVRADGTVHLPEFYNLPTGEYDVFHKVEGCKEFKAPTTLLHEADLTGGGFRSQALTCDPE